MTDENDIVLNGLTPNNIREILQDIKGKGNTALGLDVNYLYNFDKSDMDHISKICKLGRYNFSNVLDWHKKLERWYDDQTVRNDFAREIKPIQLVRNFDKVVNEGLEMIAQTMLGGSGSVFKYHAIGEGEVSDALPSDTQLVDQLSRIDVTKVADGGSLSREGSTVYIIGNHPDSIKSTEITETGVFDNQTTPDKMLDHSIFDPPIFHDQYEDSAGSTTIIYMCGV